MSYAFQSFIPHYKWMARIGFFELIPPSDSPLKASIHKMFRNIVTTLILLYNLVHIISLCLVLGDTNEMVKVFVVLLTTLNCVVKHLTLKLRTERIQGLLNTINGPYFQPTEPYHIQVLDSNARSMNRLFLLYSRNVVFNSVLYHIMLYVKRMMGKTVKVAWMPFDYQKSPAFELVLLHLLVILIIQAYGQTTVDCLISAFYSQATTQIKILRHNFENIVHFAENVIHKKQHTALNKQIDQNISKDAPDVLNSRTLQGIKLDLEKCDNEIHPEIIIKEEMKYILTKRLKLCVQHYGTIVSYVEEIQDIFNIALTFQFTVAAWVICVTIYYMSELETYLSAEFGYMLAYLLLLLVQLFIYCHHGTELTFESELLNQSIFSSDWTRTSVKFRRLLLIQMTRCVRPIEPTVAFIIPLSLDSFMAIVKFSYTLFNVLRQE